MVRKLSDDEVMDSVYTQLFGDLDSIEGKTLFDDDGKADDQIEAIPSAEPASEESGGVKITVEPVMKGAEESGRMTDLERDGEGEEDEDDKLKGIGAMSPLMAQLHGRR